MPPHRSNSTQLAQDATSLSAHITALSRFRRVLEQVQPAALDQLDDRRERQVFLLTDGKRSIAQIASLLRIPQLEVAQLMNLLLARGYVEYAP